MNNILKKLLVTFRDNSYLYLFYNLLEQFKSKSTSSQSANSLNSTFIRAGLIYYLHFSIICNNQIHFFIKKSLSRVKFEQTFSFDSFQKIHLIFSFCKDIREIYDLIKKKIVSEQIDFQEVLGSINILLNFELDLKPFLVYLTIPKIEGEANSNEIIEDLADELVKLKQRVMLLESKTLNSSLFKLSTIVKSEDDDILNTWLDGKHFQLDIQLLFKAISDGFDLKTFHSKCDNKGPTITFVETIQGLKFGGYTSASWEQSRKYKMDGNAFLFSLTTKKLFKVKKMEEAIYVGPDKGPTFGRGYDLYLADNCCSNFDSYCQSTSYYFGIPENSKVSLLSGSKYFCVKDYEVFRINISYKKVN